MNLSPWDDLHTCLIYPKEINSVVIQKYALKFHNGKYRSCYVFHFYFNKPQACTGLQVFYEFLWILYKRLPILKALKTCYFNFLHFEKWNKLKAHIARCKVNWSKSNLSNAAGCNRKPSHSSSNLFLTLLKWPNFFEHIRYHLQFLLDRYCFFG